jgi:hypothetical protein
MTHILGMRNECNVSFETSERMTPLERLECKREDNIKLDMRVRIGFVCLRIGSSGGLF